MSRTWLGVLAALSLAACDGAGEADVGGAAAAAGAAPDGAAPGSDIAAGDSVAGEVAAGDATEGDSGTSGTVDTARGGSPGDSGAADGSAGATGDASADAAPPEDAGPRTGPPAPRPYDGGHGCPALVEGKNTIKSAGKDRSFLLYLPDEPAGAPLLFLWHPAGGTAQYMANAFGAAKIAKDHGVIVVVPDACCGLVEWRFRDTEDPTADLTLFDDLLACSDEQYDVDNERVYTGGFSAGALWSSYLLIHRSEFLAAAVVFSGGVDGLFQWETPARPVPTLLAWGGETDLLYGVFSFDQQTKALSKHMQESGSFIVECDHGGGHTVPFGATKWSVPFALAHRWGEPSPYATSGLDASFPDYCSIPE